MSEKKKAFPFPEFSEDPTKLLEEPLKIIDQFNSVVTNFSNQLQKFDDSFAKLDSVLVNPLTPPPAPEFTPRRKVTSKDQRHLSYAGQSDVDYCIECGLKHSQTAKVLLREAIQRAQVGKPSSEGVKEKVRGVIEELAGYEDDTSTIKNEKVATLNELARNLRKYIYMTGAEVGSASLHDLQEIKDMVDKLVDATYQVREAEECIACTVESICGENVECVAFVDDAAKHVTDPDDIRKILKEAREKFSK